MAGHERGRSLKESKGTLLFLKDHVGCWAMMSSLREITKKKKKIEKQSRHRPQIDTSHLTVLATQTRRGEGGAS